MSADASLAEKGAAWRARARNREFQGLGWEAEGKWTGPFSFVQAADTQLGMIFSFGGPPDKSEWEEEIRLTRRAIEAVNAIRPRPRFLVVCGDLVDAMPGSSFKDAQIADLKGLLCELDPAILPVCVCGNHDIGDIPTPASIQAFQRDWGDDYFSFWVAGVKFILEATQDLEGGYVEVINSQYYHNDSETGELRAAQDAWLDTQLRPEPSRPRQHTVAFQHIPPFVKTADEERVDVFGDPRLSFNFADKALRRSFLERLKAGGVKKLFCGHYHRNAGGFDGDFEVIVTSAVGCQLGSDASGLRVVKVLEDRIEHEYYPLESVPSSVPL